MVSRPGNHFSIVITIRWGVFVNVDTAGYKVGYHLAKRRVVAVVAALGLEGLFTPLFEDEEIFQRFASEASGGGRQ